MTTAIVIVAYRSGEVIGACLDSCLKFAPNASITVVDNEASARVRHEVAARPGVRLISNDWNRGFAGGVNQGIAAAGTELVLLLNPDVQLLTGIDGVVRDCAEGAAIACGQLCGPDGRPQSGFMVRRFPTAASLIFEALGVNRLLPRNRVNVRYRCLDLDPAVPADVEQPAGAFMMVRSDAWRHAGGFDERFHPVWFEDVDFCKRIHDAGGRIRYVPSVLARHEGGHSAGKLDWASRYVYWYVSLLKWSAKHLGAVSRIAVVVAVVLGSVPRMLTGIVRERNVRPFVACCRVILVAVKCLFSRRMRAGEVAPLSISG